MFEEVESHIIAPLFVRFSPFTQVPLQFVRNHVSEGILLYLLSIIQLLH